MKGVKKNLLTGTHQMPVFFILGVVAILLVVWLKWPEPAGYGGLRVEESNDGKLVVVDDTFEVTIPDGWGYTIDNSTLEVSESHTGDIYDMYSGVSITIEEVQEKDIIEIFKNKVAIEDFNEIKKNESTISVNSTDIVVLSADWSTSYWPSNGGITNYYLIERQESNVLLSVSSIDSANLLEKEDVVARLISDILIN